MDHTANDAPRRNAAAYDDNRDNRMPEDKQRDHRDAAGGKDKAQDQKTNRGPSMIAYSVKDRGRDQDAIWKSVGAAFPHRDGKGMDVVLDAMPLDGRVTLREQRKEAFKEQRREGQDRAPSQTREQGRDR